MVQIQVASHFPDPAVLASVAVAHEDVVSAEPDLTPGHTVERNQENHPWNSNEPVNQADGLAPDRRQLAPVPKVERPILFVYSLRNASIQER